MHELDIEGSIYADIAVHITYCNHAFDIPANSVSAFVQVKGQMSYF